MERVYRNSFASVSRLIKCGMCSVETDVAAGTIIAHKVAKVCVH